MLPFGAPSNIRNFATAAVGYSPADRGTISASYTVTEPRNLETLRSWSVGYNTGLFGGRGIFTLSYTKSRGLVDEWTGSMTFRYFFGRDYSVVATAVRAGAFKSQGVNLEKTTPVGEGLGFSIGPGRAESPEGTTYAGERLRAV